MAFRVRIKNLSINFKCEKHSYPKQNCPKNLFLVKDIGMAM